MEYMGVYLGLMGDMMGSEDEAFANGSGRGGFSAKHSRTMKCIQSGLTTENYGGAKNQKVETKPDIMSFAVQQTCGI